MLFSTAERRASSAPRVARCPPAASPRKPRRRNAALAASYETRRSTVASGTADGAPESHLATALSRLLAGLRFRSDRYARNSAAAPLGKAPAFSHGRTAYYIDTRYWSSSSATPFTYPRDGCLPQPEAHRRSPATSARAALRTWRQTLAVYSSGSNSETICRKSGSRD